MTAPPPMARQVIEALAAGADELRAARQLGLDERDLLDVVLRTLDALDVPSVAEAAAVLAGGEFNAS